MRPLFALVSVACLLFPIQRLAANAPDGSIANSPNAEWDMIRFEVKAWGGLVYAWQFTPLYGGAYMKTVQGDGPEITQIKSIDEDLDRYRDLERIVRQLPVPAPDANSCQEMMPHDAYGVIRLTRGATTTEISWNAGCKDVTYTKFMSVLREADDLVSDWVSKLPITRTEPQAN